MLWYKPLIRVQRMQISGMHHWNIWIHDCEKWADNAEDMPLKVRNENSILCWVCPWKTVNTSMTQLQSTSSLSPSLRYCKYVKYLHFQYFRYAWPNSTTIIVSNCKKLWHLSAWKIIFILHFFLEILQRFYNLAVLGTLGRAGHTNKNW